jgi:hypothetical protein
MTEPHSDARLEAARPINWPELPPLADEAGVDGATSDTTNPSDPTVPFDPTVQAILDRVRQIPDLPVSDHPAAYAGMHDSLLEALNEDTSTGAGA